MILGIWVSVLYLAVERGRGRRMFWGNLSGFRLRVFGDFDWIYAMREIGEVFFYGAERN